MVEITYSKSYAHHGKVDYKLKATGHAGYASMGNDDIVCAGVSTILYTLANFLDSIGADDLSGSDSDNGNFYIECNAMANDDAVSTAFRMAVFGLSLLAEQYPDNVDVDEEDEEE